MRVCKRDAATAFATWFGVVGFFAGCPSALASLSDPGANPAMALLMIPAVPLAAAGVGAAAGFLIAWLGDRLDAPSELK